MLNPVSSFISREGATHDIDGDNLLSSPPPDEVGGLVYLWPLIS